jgi:putative tricarboxylic transport membrane protein|tara:strand:- start:6463 stop:7431 length:969 start_codon:yes stop_codon:yes gene_type:complete
MIRLVLALLLLCPAYQAYCEAPSHLGRVHFLIPAGPGGGWDGTARGVGEALLKSGLVANISYENLSGGGGGRAIAKLIETAGRQGNTLMVNSTPIVVRSLQKIFPQSFRDLTPIASVIADYGCFVVRKDSPYSDWGEIIAAFQSDARSIKVAGGSVRGSTDHLVIAKAIKEAGMDPRQVRYVPYDGGGRAMTGLLTGETQLLSTGLSETLDLANAGEVKIIATTAPARLPEIPGVPTLKELGYELIFANWRGFFGPPGMSSERIHSSIDVLTELMQTEEFEAVRARNGWAILFQSGAEFYRFLEQQERDIGQMMRDLGFLKS